MTTYVTLRTRITDELANDGALTDAQVNYAINDAIKQYERRPWWFNQKIATLTTVADQEYYTDSDLSDISSMVAIVSAQITYSSVKSPLRPAGYGEIDDIQDGQVVAVPQLFAYFTESIRLYPIPDGAYTVTLSYIYRLTALSADADTNAWTTDAEELIRQSAKRRIAINYFHADDLAQRFAAAEQDAFSAMLAEDRRRRPNTFLRVPPMGGSEFFNINIG